jgi:hypothetical protein
MTVFAYVAAYLLVPLFGLSLTSSIDSRSARIGLAFLAGALLLTIEATLFTMIGVRWSIVGLSLPLLLASGVVFWRTKRTDKSVRATPAAIAIICIAILHFLLSIITAQSINPDYVLFWGTKSVHFALSRSLDAGYLLSRYAPPRVDYPPLLPIFQAWGLLFSHSMPWITAAAMSAVWLAAAVPVINWLTGSPHATAFWTAAMAASLAFCGSGGNAESMLVVYISMGAAAIVAKRTSIAAIAFAGAMLTKEEALVTIGAILIGVVIYDRSIRRAATLAASSAAGASVWFAFQKRFGMHVGYDRVTLTHSFHWSNLPTIFREAPKSLAAGCWGLSWLIPLAILIYIALKTPERLKVAIPLLVPIPLLFAFFVYLYLQFENSLAMKMWWILPRLSQPALSLMILAAAFAAGDRMRRHES